MKRVKYLVTSFGEIREFSKTNYIKFLTALKNEDSNKAEACWKEAKYIGVIDANITDYNSEDAKFKLECLR